MTEPSEARTTIRLHDDLSLELSRQERLRLLIRVMCELVAYGKDDTSDVENTSSAGSASEAPAPSR
jgi:hypothetical protein